ncbi:hypothetical protein SBC1_02690 [Caballeronia sp. SBC1]|nr:hypothetical protein SBC1_02690 [Caballeronia sp. SBC1]
MGRSVHQSLEIRDTLSERISYDCEKSEEGGTDVYFYLMPPSGHVIEHGARARVLHVAPDMLTIFPFMTSSSGYGYEPKYSGLDRVWRDNLDERRATIKLRMSRQK